MSLPGAASGLPFSVLLPFLCAPLGSRNREGEMWQEKAGGPQKSYQVRCPECEAEVEGGVAYQCPACPSAGYLFFPALLPRSPSEGHSVPQRFSCSSASS